MTSSVGERGPAIPERRFESARWSSPPGRTTVASSDRGSARGSYPDPRGRELPRERRNAVLCKEIMKQEVECLSQEDAVEVAARKMRDKNVGFLPVCDGAKKVIGTLTDRDIVLRVVADGEPATTGVGDVMTREIVACRPEDDIRRAEQLMGQHRKSRILCTHEDGRLAGVISLSDIAQREDDRNTARTVRRVTEREAPAR